MRQLLLAVILLTGTAYATECDDYKKNALKYEKMGMSAKNLDMGAKYLQMAIENKKNALLVCFYSGSDKIKIDDEIKEMEKVRIDMINEAARIRKQELDVARESAQKNYYYHTDK